jgi:photosystem II stability/assembly factor-like uncharacterized protein
MSNRVLHPFKWIAVAAAILPACGLNGSPSTQASSARAALTDEQHARAALLDATFAAVGPAPEMDDGVAMSGRVNVIAISPSYDGAGTPAMFLGTAGGGIWRSTNFRAAAPTWTPLTDKLPLPSARKPGGQFVGALVVDPNHPQTLYAGLGDAPALGWSDGILKSTDGGGSWTYLGEADFAGTEILERIVIDPRNSDLWVVGGPSLGGNGIGIRHSTDGGGTFTRVEDGLPPNCTVWDLDYTQDENSLVTLYAGVEDYGAAHLSGIYRMRLGVDAQWVAMPIDGPRDQFDKITLSASHVPFPPSDQAHLRAYAIVHKINDNTHIVNVYHLDGPHSSWYGAAQPPNLNPQWGYDQAIGVAPDGQDGTVYIGGVTSYGPGIFVSSDYGDTWTSIDQGSNGVKPHSDLHAWAFWLDEVYSGNDGGLFRYRTGPRTWESLNTNLQTTLTQGVDIHPSDPGQLVAGNQDDGIVIRSGGVWTGSGGDTGEVRFDPFTNNRLFNVSAVDGGNYFHRSDDGGKTWHDINPGWNQNPPYVDGTLDRPLTDYPPFELDRTSSRVYLGLVHLVESTDGGNTWNPISGPLAGKIDDRSQITAIASTSDPNRLYVALKNQQLFVTADHGGTWSAGCGGAPLSNPILRIGVDSANANRAYLIAGPSILETTDGGMTCNDVTGDLKTVGFALNALAVIHESTSAAPWLVVGTDVGAYVSFDEAPARHWQAFGNGVPEAKVTDIAYRAALNRLAFATYGRGVFLADITPPCLPTRTTCDPGACNVQDDGCGNLISCGLCGSGQICDDNLSRCVATSSNAGCHVQCQNVLDACMSGDGTLKSSCSTTFHNCMAACDCKPKSCADLGASCGDVADGCGHTISCGGCSAPQSCGAITPNVCGCVPRTCGSSCGNIPDGCGGTLSCTPCHPKNPACVQACTDGNDNCTGRTCAAQLKACLARC